MTDDSLDELLSQPTVALVDAMARISGDLLILGAGGKMGPSLARLAVRASEQKGLRRRVTAVSRFTNASVRTELQRHGVEVLDCDLFDRRCLSLLPDAPNVIYMAGQKFGTTADAARTWAINAYLPGLVAEQFRNARMVVFSTGNVYPLSSVSGAGPAETAPVGPIGEYAQSALARERVFQFFSAQNQTRVTILRLNYAIEPRYGVLRDIADQVRARRPVNVTMGWVNLIWQRDANAIALRSLDQSSVPPTVINVTGRPAYSVRWLANQFAERWRLEPLFDGVEAPTALLSNAALAESLYGRPEVGIETMIDLVATWVERGGRSLGKPTHFEVREGKF